MVPLSCFAAEEPHPCCPQPPPTYAEIPFIKLQASHAPAHQRGQVPNICPMMLVIFVACFPLGSTETMFSLKMARSNMSSTRPHVTEGHGNVQSDDSGPLLSGGHFPTATPFWGEPVLGGSLFLGSMYCRGPIGLWKARCA